MALFLVGVIVGVVVTLMAIGTFALGHGLPSKHQIHSDVPVSIRRILHPKGIH